MKKKSIIFAAFNAKEQTYSLCVIAIIVAILLAHLSAKIRGCLIPVGYYTCVLVCSLARTGGDSLSYLLILYFHSQMPKNNENASNTQGVSTSTPSGAKTVPIEAFNIEMNAKNKAYYFILSNGLFEQYCEFCRNYKSGNLHHDCLSYLSSKI